MSLLPHLHSILEIKSLSVPIIIGLTKEERAHKQNIIFHVKVFFPKAPKAYTTNALSDTVCYAQICEHIKNLTKGKSFTLIESLCHYIWTQLRKTLPSSLSLELSVKKQDTQELQLNDGVYYTITGY